MLDSASSVGTGASSDSSLSEDASVSESIVADSSLGTGHHGPEGLHRGIVGAGGAEVEVIRSKAAGVEVRSPLSREELDAMVTITLSETESFVMLDFAASVVEADTEEASVVEEENAAYEKLKTARIGSDAYSARGVQTYNRDLKNKEVQWDPAPKKTAGTQATGWSIHDEMVGLSPGGDGEDDDDEDHGGRRRRRRRRGKNVSVGTGTGEGNPAGGAAGETGWTTRCPWAARRTPRRPLWTRNRPTRCRSPRRWPGEGSTRPPPSSTPRGSHETSGAGRRGEIHRSCRPG